LRELFKSSVKFNPRTPGMRELYQWKSYGSIPLWGKTGKNGVHVEYSGGNTNIETS